MKEVGIFEPQNLTELKAYSKDISSSQLVPQSMRGKPADIMLAITLGKELGLSTVQSLQSVAIINGKPTIFGDAALALVLGSGLCEDIVETVEDGVATCRGKRKGMESHQSRTFSIEDAKRAKLWGKRGPWSDYPMIMLKHRARGQLLRDLWADCLRGTITTEEARDYPTENPAALPPLPRDTVTVTAMPAQESRQEPNDDEAEAAARVTADGFPELQATDAEVVEPTVEPVEQKPTGVITKAQVTKVQTAIRAAGLDYKELKPKILESYGIESLTELPKAHLDDLLDRVAAFLSLIHI